jgi:hypothetical protein
MGQRRMDAGELIAFRYWSRVPGAAQHEAKRNDALQTPISGLPEIGAKCAQVGQARLAWIVTHTAVVAVPDQGTAPQRNRACADC